MFLNILLESSSMAGEVWNETLANFFPTKGNMTQALQFISCCCKSGKVWQVKYGTKLSPIVLPTSKWQMLTTQALQFAVVAKQWENMCFSTLSSSKVVVWQATKLSPFLPTFVSNIATFKKKHLWPKRCIFFLSVVTVAKQWEKHVFQQVAAWQVKYGTKLSPIFANICQQHRNFSEKTLLMTQTLQFFSFSAVVAKQWEKTCFSTSP